jgi:hypothetical protein
MVDPSRRQIIQGWRGHAQCTSTQVHSDSAHSDALRAPGGRHG